MATNIEHSHAATTRSHPLVTIGIFALALIVLIGSGSYFSSQRKDTGEAEVGFQRLIQMVSTPR